MKALFTTIVCIAFLFQGKAQEGYSINRAAGTITIDGVLDDAGWTNVTKASNFTQYFPYDSIPAESATEFMITYDDQFLYFAAKMYNLKEDRDYVVSSLRRDYRGNLDGITLVLDPFQDNTNAFQFGINPYGVQREGLISNGGQRGNDLSLSWDNKWYAEARQEKGYWTAEAAIPFKTLRFKEGLDKWNINVYRIDTQNGERSTWAPIPRNFILLSLAFMKELQWDEPLKKPGANVSIIPYLAGGGTQDFDADDNTINGNSAIGGDAKVALGPGLNLDLTVNPDFSQVELDEQVTNLDRFELFFPERRQFFLENADLFQDFGHPFLARPFFSRRIGIARDTATGVNLQNKIHYGARLSGKLDNNTRIGLLNMQAAKDESIGLPALNYTVGVVQRKIFARSNIGAIFVNKESFQNNSELDTANRYNRVVGVDYNILSADGKWNGKMFFHKSFDNDKEDDSFSQTSWISYQSRNWNFSWAHVYVGENYNAEAGFVPRTGLFRINPDLGYSIFPSSGLFTSHRFTAQTEFFWNKERVTDRLFGIDYEANLLNTSRFQAGFSRTYTYLQNSFDPTRTDGQELAEGTFYTYDVFSFNFRSDARKLFSYTLQGQLGQYFNGSRYNLRTTINYRFQPYVAIRLNIDYNRIELPDPYNDADLFLIGPRFDVTLTKKIFFTNFIQYNSQLDNVNINARFQYRYAPVSDLFIVYTDNYNTDPLNENGWSPVNRALILKLTYWFNP
ncbi:MAG: DUF5916 domain-containing protein [Cytophagales bacterium]|nr:DUF5916 domain-containing protein [Cytophagales bacterium]